VQHPLQHHEDVRGAVPGRHAGGHHWQVKLGEGRVVRTLNEHYSVVEVDPGVEFEEGATVEKL
jgi:hypothetical protein